MQAAACHTPHVAHAWKPGLRAIKNVERQKFVIKKGNNIDGSIDIDAATKELYPNDYRWDYAIGVNGKVFFVEIHPATESEVDTVICKLKWLKQWLNNKAPCIKALQHPIAPFFWLFTNRNMIPKNSKKLRALAQNGIPQPTLQWHYEQIN